MVCRIQAAPSRSTPTKPKYAIVDNNGSPIRWKEIKPGIYMASFRGSKPVHHIATSSKAAEVDKK